MRKATTTRQIGTFSVDAGLCWIGDPCYFWPGRSDGQTPTAVEEIGSNWYQFCDKLAQKGFYERGYVEFNAGIVTNTGVGDGTYPVYATFEGHIVTKITIDFMGDEESDDEE